MPLDLSGDETAALLHEIDHIIAWLYGYRQVN